MYKIVYYGRVMRVHAGMRRRSRESITRVIRHFGMAISIMYIGYAGPKVSEDDDASTTPVVRVTLQCVTR